MKTISLLLALVMSAGNCFASDATRAITAAVKTYVASSSGMSQVTVTVEKVDGDYARARVTPAGGAEADPAWVFLQKKKGTWTALTLGTYFEPGDYKSFGIPPGLWVN